MRKLFVCGAVLLGLTMPLATQASAAGFFEADVSVFHGINGQDLGLDPNLPVDVKVDDVCLIDIDGGLRFGETFPPAPLTVDAPATIRVQVFLDGEGASCAGDPVIDQQVDLLFGQSVTIAAHLTEQGAATITPFADNPMDPAGGRVTVRHAAAAPLVDVLYQKKNRRYFRFAALQENIANGTQQSVDLAPGSYVYKVRPANSRAELARDGISIAGGENIAVCAVGSLANGTLEILPCGPAF